MQPHRLLLLRSYETVSPYGPGLIGDIDTLIAATALHYGLTLVTTDSDFTRVPGLQLHYLPLARLR